MSKALGFAWERRHGRALQVTLILSALVMVLLLGANWLYEGKLISGTQRAYVWLAMCNVLAVLGLQLFSGNTGMMSIAHVAFLAMGAYVSAVFTMPPMLKGMFLKGLPETIQSSETSLIFALLVAVLAAMLIAWVVGVVIVRLSYDGVVISTFALLLVVQTIIFAAKGWTNGAMGVQGMPRLTDPWLLGGVTIIGIAIAAFLKESRMGLQVRAARDDKLAAQSMGVNARRLNLIFWVISAGLAAAAGVMMVHIAGAASPRSFYITLTIELIAMLVLGGQRSVTGAVLGALFVTGLIKFVGSIEGGFSLVGFEMPAMFGATQLVLSLAILLLLYKRPDGIMGLAEAVIPALQRKRPAAEVTRELDLHQNGEFKLDGLTKQFGGLTALDGASFDVHPGEIMGLIGPNGAGKSTLINTAMGGYFATSGMIWVDGQDATLWPAWKLARGGIGRTFQQIKLAKSLTVLENVSLPLSVVLPRGEALEAKALGWLERLGIADYADKLPGELAYGDQRRVEIARALALQPTFLLLDEPAAGMNHQETDGLRQLLTDLRDELGLGIIIVEHDLPLIMTMCDKIVVLNRGALIARGTPTEIQNNPDVIEAYIGPDAAADLQAKEA